MVPEPGEGIVDAGRDASSGPAPVGSSVVGPDYRDRAHGHDTSVEAAGVQRAIIASKTPEERVAMAIEMPELVRETVLIGIRRRNPDFDEAHVRAAFIKVLHGAAIADAMAAQIEAGGRV